MPRRKHYRTTRIRSLCTDAIYRCLARHDIYLELGYIDIARRYYHAELTLAHYLDHRIRVQEALELWDEQHIGAH